MKIQPDSMSTCDLPGHLGCSAAGAAGEYYEKEIVKKLYDAYHVVGGNGMATEWNDEGQMIEDAGNVAEREEWVWSRS